MKIFVNGKLTTELRLKPKEKRVSGIMDKDFKIDENRWNLENLRKRAKIIGKNKVKVGRNIIEFKEGLIEKLINKLIFKGEFWLLKRAINFFDFYDYN